MKLFLSVPFSSRCDTNGVVFKEYREPLERLLVALRAAGHEVFCAVEYTDWQLGGTTSPAEELQHDFEQIDWADVVIVLLEERVSSGIQLESGYAYAKGKPIDVYQIGKASWSNQAFGKLNGHEIYGVDSIEAFTDAVSKTYAS
jgi:nucleoside 2-deoxyribosyltransferase